MANDKALVPLNVADVRRGRIIWENRLGQKRELLCVPDIAEVECAEEDDATADTDTLADQTVDRVVKR